MDEITAVLEESEKLREELAALRASLSNLGSHNLKQGIMLAQMGVEPEDLAKVSINKVRADAIRDALYQWEHCSDKNIRVNLEYHARQIEAGL
tara:strand:- start:537 stop:815 length:279 start_codon:yes stop_codon:yes gene_type:complete